MNDRCDLFRKFNFITNKLPEILLFCLISLRQKCFYSSDKFVNKIIKLNFHLMYKFIFKVVTKDIFFQEQ